jgi:N-acetylglucosaminyldiphosphoundecaprenol N-acetyl-beta-D-mannosaminyltransferase
MTAGAISHLNVLGTKVAILNLERAAEMVAEWIDVGATGKYVCVTDVHCIMQSYRREEVRRAYNSADACVPDGMPLTWVGRRRGRPDIGRVYGPDLMLRLLEISRDRGYTNFFLGGAHGVADELKGTMEARFPGLQVVGTYCPPFRPLTIDEKSNLASTINGVRPDILWVGLGAPKQDLFMAEFKEVLESKVMIGVGAAFDFHTGRVRQAPRWMMRAGLEWLFRLCMEPLRLAPRYFRNNPAFIWHILLQESGLRRYPTEEEDGVG